MFNYILNFYLNMWPFAAAATRSMSTRLFGFGGPALCCAPFGSGGQFVAQTLIENASSTLIPFLCCGSRAAAGSDSITRNMNGAEAATEPNSAEDAIVRTEPK